MKLTIEEIKKLESPDYKQKLLTINSIALNGVPENEFFRQLKDALNKNASLLQIELFRSSEENAKQVINALPSRINEVSIYELSNSAVTAVLNCMQARYNQNSANAITRLKLKHIPFTAVSAMIEKFPSGVQFLILDNMDPVCLGLIYKSLKEQKLKVKIELTASLETQWREKFAPFVELKRKEPDSSAKQDTTAPAEPSVSDSAEETNARTNVQSPQQVATDSSSPSVGTSSAALFASPASRALAVLKARTDKLKADNAAKRVRLEQRMNEHLLTHNIADLEKAAENAKQNTDNARKERDELAKQAGPLLTLGN